MVVEGLPIEGEPVKRYRIVWWGTSVGHWDNAKEALDGYDQHDKILRPAIVRTSRKAEKDKPYYQFFDGRKEITLADLRAAKVEEQGAPQRPAE